jgi:hypothetical protein
LLQLTIADVGVYFGASATAVAQLLLDTANIRTAFVQLGCIAVTQPMQGCRFADTGLLQRIAKNQLKV